MTLILNGTDNSATTPAVTGTDTDTGVYYPAANQVALATAGTQAMLANASQGVQFANAIGVGATTPTTSGAGITFPATQSASSNANTLDDYEEGTWTPVLSGSGGGAASGLTVAGVYTKTGNMVIATAFITYAKNTLAGYANFEGLPFAAASGYYPQGTLLMDQMTAQTYNPLVQLGSAGTVAIPITGNYGTGTHDQLQWSAKNSSQGTIRFTLCYSAN
jgi:hypothetical protein